MQFSSLDVSQLTMQQPQQPPFYLVLDTCVLISNTVRKLLFRLAEHNCLRPVWADYIGVEWRRNIPKIWDVSEDYAQCEWEAMEALFPHANMGEVEALTVGLHQSDKKDHHVIACARRMLEKAPLDPVAIITWNIRDFARRELRDLGLQLYDPDQLLVMLWHQHQDLLIELFNYFADDAAEVGKPDIGISELLKRERLFRLRKLYEGALTALPTTN